MQPGLGAHRSSKGKWGIALGHRAHLKIVATQCPEACGDGFQSEARPLSAPHVPHLLGLPAAPATRQPGGDHGAAGITSNPGQVTVSW